MHNLEQLNVAESSSNHLRLERADLPEVNMKQSKDTDKRSKKIEKLTSFFLTTVHPEKGIL